MPLLPKIIYKNPCVEGACHYSLEEDLNNNGKHNKPIFRSGKEKADIAGQESLEFENEAVVFWPLDKEPDAGTEAGKKNRSSRGNGQFSKNQEYKDKQDGNHNAGTKDPEEIAAAILEEKMEKAMKDAYEKGRAKAEKETKAAREKAEKELKTAEKALQEARRKSKDIVASAENKIIEIAVAVAERLLYKQLELDPEAVTGIVKETMNILDGGEQVELYVNSTDLDVCLGYRESLKQDFKEIIKLDVIADDNIPRGSCRVESESGVAEYIISEEKNQLEELLLNIARNEKEEPAEKEEYAYEQH